MRGTRPAFITLLVGVACGGLSKQTVGDDAGAADQGSGATGESGGKLGQGGASGSGTGGSGSGGGGTAPGGGGSSGASGTAPDPCGLGPLEFGPACSEGEVSILEDPTCSAVFSCTLGVYCLDAGIACDKCLAAYEDASDSSNACVAEADLPNVGAFCAMYPMQGNPAFPECAVR